MTTIDPMTATTRTASHAATDASASATPFFGPWVVRAAFTVALFGWGVGFYGPPVFLQAVMARTGWSLSLVSAAVTCHFLFGAGVVAILPRLHRRFGIASASIAGVLLLSAGIVGWAVAKEPWQLFMAALCTGAGWVPLGAAGINAMVSQWYARGRPLALAKAYNGASLGGVVFSPMWVALIGTHGFAVAALAVAAAMLLVLPPLVWWVAGRTPASLGQTVDGLPPFVAAPSTTTATLSPEAKSSADEGAVPLWRQRCFLTLAAAMALGLFAQIGLIAQLYGLMAPVLGAQAAGWTMALATGCGMAGRLAVARLLHRAVDRRSAALASLAVQALGTVLLWLCAGPAQPWLIVLGVVLFGLGIGNATSLPPLIAQAEFTPVEVPRVVARCVAISQAFYAFAPALLALLLVGGASGGAVLGAGTSAFFGVVLAVQCLAMASLQAGRGGMVNAR